MFNLVAIIGGIAVWLVGSVAAHGGGYVGVPDAGGRRRAAGGAGAVAVADSASARACSPISGCAIPGTRRIAMLMAPATLGVAAVQINVVINSSFASLISDGALSWLSYAFRLMQLPIGVFGVAVGHHLPDAAVARRRRGRTGTRCARTLRRGLRMVLFLTVPSTVGLALLGVPIIRLIFEHGRFTPQATLETARALSGYAVGLVAYAAIKVVAPAFYALGRTRVPLIASVSAVAANLVWNIATFRRFGHVGLALGTSMAALVNSAVLAFAFQAVRRLRLARAAAAVRAIMAAAASWRAAVWALSSLARARCRRRHGRAAVKALDPDRHRASRSYFVAARVFAPRGGADAARAAVIGADVRKPRGI